MIGLPPEVTNRTSVGPDDDLVLSMSNNEAKKAPETGAGRRRESVMFW
jgi:hypothetical protein